MAASGQDEVTGPDGETFIEKYTRGVSAVETILTLDRLRQSVAVKELINAKSKHLLPMGGQSSIANNSSPFMRKTVSVPNMSQVSHFHNDVDNYNFAYLNRFFASSAAFVYFFYFLTVKIQVVILSIGDD